MPLMTRKLDSPWRSFGHGLAQWLAARASRCGKETRAQRATPRAFGSNHMRRDIGLAERETPANPLRHQLYIQF